MIDLKQDNWIQLCHLNEANEICFTAPYLHLIKCLGGGARKFAAQLIGGWDKDCETLLDYFGPDDVAEDWYSGIDGDAMDVGELTTDTWEVRGVPVDGLKSEWHRDILRAKLLTIKLPEKLISEYVNLIQDKQKGR